MCFNVFLLYQINTKFMIQVINRALDILEFLAKDPEKERTLSEISDEFNLNSGTCANIIKTLVTRNYIEKLDKKKGYCLGSKAYGLTGNENYKKDLTEAAKDELESLTEKLNENSLLAVLDGEIRRVILRVISGHSVQASTASEKRAYDSSSGRVLIAMLSDVDLDRFIKKNGLPYDDEWEGVTDENSLRKQIAKIRSNGYATQLTKGKIAGLAVPIYKNKKVIASLSVYMPEFRYSNSDKNAMVRLLNTVSDQISAKLG